MGLSQRIIKKIARIVEGPPVRERIVVKMVGTSKHLTSVPCFLIGVYRSGTTLLRYVLDSHSNIAVPPETNFLYRLADFWRSEWIRKGLAGVGVDEEVVRVRLREFASGILDDYAAAKGKRRWVDKTPAYIDILDFLDFLYGEDCRYIMLYRHGLDVAGSLAEMYEKNVLSGPAKDFADSEGGNPRLTFAKYWAERCDKMMAFEESHPERCCRIYYERYSSEPERYLPPLFEFLGERWEPEVLKFNKKLHDFGLQDSKISEIRSFKPRIGTYKTWNAEEIAEAKDIVSNTLRRLGYEI